MEEIKEVKSKHKPRLEVRILDSATRQRRKEIHLASLEKDNFIEDDSVQISAIRHTSIENARKNAKRCKAWIATNTTKMSFRINRFWRFGGEIVPLSTSEFDFFQQT